MRWARGFFRLWLVLSLFWIVGMSLAVRPDHAYQAYNASKMGLGENNGYLSAAVLSSRADNLIAAGNVDGANKLLAMAAAAKRSPEGLYKTERRKAFERQRRKLKEGIGLIFLPVIFAFMIGACLVWAFRGFQRSPTA
jgi:hypothetical protein